MTRTLLLAFLGWLASLLVSGAQSPMRFDDAALQGDLAAPLPYVVSRVFTEQTFRNPVDFIPEPGSNRIFILQLNGEICAFDSSENSSDRDTLLRLREEVDDFHHLYGMAFHPRYETNAIVYLAYTIQGRHLEDGTRVIECRMNHSTNKIDLSGSRLLLTWFQGGHNGASLQFGPDGYLYISAGDAEKPNPPDELGAGQDCSNLLSTIMRIDADRRDPGLPYAIPPDNPFNDLAGARPEIWAFGFRNPWRMSFDKENGDLWVGDVGWDTWEMIYRVQRGANYGWSVMEGRQPINVTWERGPVPISPPIAEHDHTEARSITGGYVYHGSRFPELRGAYIYGDYATGKIWALWQDGGECTRLEEIADTELQIICFGQTWDGEVYIVDYAGGIFDFKKRETKTPADSAKRAFPEKLSETGLFTDVAAQTPADGLISYEISHARWADGLEAKRWITLPQGGKIRFEHEGRPNTKFQVFPEGTLIVKTLSAPESGRPIETQILQRRHWAWRAFSYLWDDKNDATLVPPQGKQPTITLGHGDTARTQLWPAVGASECLACHNAQAGSVLGLRNWQLSEESRVKFKEFGILGNRRRQKDRRVEAHPARNYLDVNCASCHRMNGGGLVPMNLVRKLPNDRLAAIGVPPQRGTFGIDGVQVIAAGQPERSALYYRMAKLGSGRMPHLGSKVVDAEGLELIYKWIESLDPDADRTLASSDEVPKALVQLYEEGEAAIKETTTPAVADLHLRFAKHEATDAITDATTDPGDPAAILALTGDAARGETLLQGPRGALCLTCHQLGSLGRDFGPRFDGIGRRRSNAHLLESLLLPSADIATAFVNFTITTKDSEIHSGFIRHHDRSGILLRDAALQEHTIDLAEIATMTAGELSVMPAGLAQAFTDGELADLLAYLASLR